MFRSNVFAKGPVVMNERSLKLSVKAERICPPTLPAILSDALDVPGATAPVNTEQAAQLITIKRNVEILHEEKQSATKGSFATCPASGRRLWCTNGSSPRQEPNTWQRQQYDCLGQ